MSQDLVGIIKEKKQVNGKGNKFVLTDLTTRKDLTVITFGGFDLNWLGETVQFQAEYNEKFKNYIVKGDIAVIEEGAVQAPVQPVVAEAPKKRGRPAKVAPSVAPSAPTTSAVDSGREAYRVEAEAGALLNLKSAQRVAKELGFTDATVGDLVALADIIGRTQTAIFMDCKKDSRMSSFKPKWQKK